MSHRTVLISVMCQLPTCVMLCLAATGPLAACGIDRDDELIEVAAADAEKDDGGTMLEIHDTLALPGQSQPVTKVFKTAAAFQAYLGVAPPMGWDFTTKWVIYSAAGSWVGPVDGESILSVRRSTDGYRLTITAETVLPSDDCWQPSNATVSLPAALVTIDRQSSAVTELRTVRKTFTRDCAAVCGAELEEQLAWGARGAVYVSASKQPYKPFTFDGAGDAGLTSTGFLTLLGKPATTPIAELDWMPWIGDRLGGGPEWDEGRTELESKNIINHWHMKQTVDVQLTDLRVFDVGADTDVEGVRPLYIAGKTSCGDVAGYSTKIVAP